MTTPRVEGLLTRPYVSVAEFKAAPTWLDNDDLIPGGTGNAQDDELNNVLLRASAWADNFCDQRLGGHTVYEQCRVRPDKWGRIYLHPSNNPVRQVTGLAYGWDFTDLTVLSDLTQTWVEDARGIVVSLMPVNGAWLGSLQFGAVAPPGEDMYVEYSYVAGYACTALSAGVSSGASSLTVLDGTGFQPASTGLLGPLGGSTARIWEPGFEEAVSLSALYTAGSSTLALASALAFDHAAGAAISELPAEVRQAVISYAIGLLMREDVTADEPFAHTPYGPTTRRSNSGGRGGGLISEAELMLSPYRRVR